MAFQNQAYIIPALGKQGIISRQNPIAQGSPVFAENDENGNNIVAGGFVFQGTNSEQVKPTATSGTVPLGVASYSQYQIGITADCNINQGEVLQNLYRGCIFSKPFINVAKVNQKVLIDPTTGDIMASDKETETVEDVTFINTGWTVKTGNSAGQVVEIQRI